MIDLVEQAQKEYERFERVLGDTSLELIAEIESLRQQYVALTEASIAAINGLNQRLAQCQAREIRKNDAIDCAVYYINNPDSSKPFALSVCADARALPSDSTSLPLPTKARLKMTYKLGKDGWPTDETVIASRDSEIESLRQQRAEVIDECGEYACENNGLKRQLAECQADNKRLRDALKSAGHYAVYGAKFHAREGIEQALAIPSDSTALDTLKKQWQREALLGAAKRFDDQAAREATNSVRRIAFLNCAEWLRRMAEEEE